MPYSIIPPQLFSVEDYEKSAAKVIDHIAWSYLVGGSGDELTLEWNKQAFQRIQLQGRVLNNFEGANTKLTLLGNTLPFPILLAPVAWQKLFHKDGELATMQAASAIGAGMVVSTMASTLLEELAEQATKPLWFQLYIQADRTFTAELVKRAELAGYKALVLTVDAPISGVRNREQRVNFRLPQGVSSVNLEGMHVVNNTANLLESPLFSGQLASVPTWQDIEWLQSITSLPILLKGVTSVADAEQAIQLGVNGLIISNHGGRVLDTLPAAIELLPRIAEHVAGRVPILMDGGIRRGTDILKALALGANAVLVGRPYIYALAVAGAVGVVHLINILRAELEAAMVLTGCRTLADINPSVIWQS
ncbi:alpha-hydroxy acid oxidase [Entomomonas asaccharolytica]|nr:alpha-hydroxy acid oxidase [Entomomonas asaccharolytica]